LIIWRWFTFLGHPVYLLGGKFACKLSPQNQTVNTLKNSHEIRGVAYDSKVLVSK